MVPRFGATAPGTVPVASQHAFDLDMSPRGSAVTEYMGCGDVTSASVTSAKCWIHTELNVALSTE